MRPHLFALRLLWHSDLTRSNLGPPAEAIARKVGIITLPTRADVARAAGVAVEEVAITDERIGAIVLSGPQVRLLLPAVLLPPERLLLLFLAHDA